MTDPGYEPPRPGLWWGWIVFGLLAIALAVSGGLMLAGRIGQPVAGRPTPPPSISAGTPVTEKPSAPKPSVGTTPPTSTAPRGEKATVTGVADTHAITCADNAVSVSGVRNTVALSGHCTRVDVSGVENKVTIDSADAIDVSGLRNDVIYRSGEPELTRSGLDNTIERG